MPIHAFKRFQWILIFLFSFFENSQAGLALSKNLDPLQRIHDQEPSFHEVMRAVFTEEQLEWGGLNRLNKKLKQAPWLPTLYVGYDRSLRKASAISINDNISVTGSGVTVGPEGNDFDSSFNTGDVVHVRAVWKLGEMIYHPETLNLYREKRALAQMHFQIIDQIDKIYAERRKLLTRYFVQKSSSTEKRILFEAVWHLTDKLDALTGKKFHHQWWRRF